MNIYTPYTYWLYHKPTKKFYYGSRTAKNCSPKDFWNTYFTSSKVVHSMIESYGKDSFIFRIHKIFSSQKEAIEFEYTILKHFKAGTNERFLNKHHTKTVIWTDELRIKNSNSHYGKPLSENHKQAISKSKIGKSHPHTKEWIEKAAKSRTGLTRSIETKLKMSEIAKKNAPRWNYYKSNIHFYGSLSEFCDEFGYTEKKKITKAFYSNKSYDGWIRQTHQ